LQHVIFDITTNARWAIKKDEKNKKGLITIETQYNKEDNAILVSILDNGIGIEKENIDKIFEPFFTTKNIGEGTGMGLSIAYKIIKEHKGSIKVQSEVNKGTTFVIKLPINSK
jgi:signal transduction histidine kinase